MTNEQQLIKNAVQAGDALPQPEMGEAEYAAQSPEHKAWSDAYNALREYVKQMPDE